MSPVRSSCGLLGLVLCCGALAGCGKAGGALGGGKAGALDRMALNAGGESPPWSAQLRAGLLHVSVVDGPNLAARTTVERQGRSVATWTAQPPAKPGTALAVLKLTVEVKPCQDATTGLTYPLTATLVTASVRRAGCAARPGQGLGPRA